MRSRWEKTARVKEPPHRCIHVDVSEAHSRSLYVCSLLKAYRNDIRETRINGSSVKLCLISVNVLLRWCIMDDRKGQTCVLFVFQSQNVWQAWHGRNCTFWQDEAEEDGDKREKPSAHQREWVSLVPMCVFRRGLCQTSWSIFHVRSSLHLCCSVPVKQKQPKSDNCCISTSRNNTKSSVETRMLTYRVFLFF